MTKKPPKQEDIGAKLASLASIIADAANGDDVQLVGYRKGAQS